jgi:hypothetical protein
MAERSAATILANFGHLAHRGEVTSSFVVTSRTS